jgi:hypothetical protein
MERSNGLLGLVLGVLLAIAVAACAGPTAVRDLDHEAITLGSLSTKGISFGYGSLLVSGTVVGIDKNGLTIDVEAHGYYKVLCGAPGNDNWAPGQNPASASSPSFFPYSETARGRLVFDGDDVEVENPPVDVIDPAVACANARWRVKLADDDVFYWTGVTLRFYDRLEISGTPKIVQVYSCVTTKLDTPPADPSDPPATVYCDLVSEVKTR